MEKSNRRYAALDGWRGVAAIGVAAFHFGMTNHFYPIPLIRNAGPYVDFFFVLSGFVITHTYASRVRTAHDVGIYMIRRFGRLWPLHVFTLLCLVGLEFAKWALVASAGLSAGEAPFSGSAAAVAIPAHLAFLQAFGIFEGYTWNGPSWSIGSEFWTYLVFAGVCLAGPRKRSLISIALVVVGFSTLAIGNDANLTATHDLGFFRCILGFFVGVLTYDWLMSRRSRTRMLFSPTAMEILLVGIAIAFLIMAPKLQQISSFLGFLPLVIFSGMVLVFAEERGKLSQWLLKAPIQSLGRWSYSIYMVHFVVLTVLNSGLRVGDKVLGTNFMIPDAASGEPLFRAPLLLGDAIFLVYLAIVVTCASLTWRFIEEPFRVFFNGIARRGEMSAAARRGRPSGASVSASE
jgi:peptidoglycan/LPS O-acetylase OafA/YrhL